MPSASLEGLARQPHVDIDRRLLAGIEAEARGDADRAVRAYAELFLARRRLRELVADPSYSERP